MAAFFSESDYRSSGIMPLTSVKLWKQSTYDEKGIFKKILDTGESDCFQRAAIQLALVGWGNKSLGCYFKEDDTEEQVSVLMERHGFLASVESGTKLKDDDVTVTRLVRVFRYHIRDYIAATGETSYLYDKYCTNEDADPVYVFPGAEHLVEERQHVDVLIETYEELDAIKGSNFCGRIKRVFVARNVEIKI